MFTVGTLAAWGACIFVLVRFDPWVGAWLTHFLFYAAFALALQGTLMLAILVRHQKQRQTFLTREVAVRIGRQAAFIVLFSVVLLMLSARRLLHWWNVLPLALLTITLELFVSSLGRRGRAGRPVSSARTPGPLN